MERLPSLNSIRIFETVARLLSYTAAAKELHVTTSALSHRIKALEAELGVTLIKRTPQSVTLTPIGKQYYEQIAAGLTQLASATNALHRAKGARILRISAPPMLSYRWLLPRLERFMSAFPDIHVELTATRTLSSVMEGQADIGFHHLRTSPPDLHATPVGTNHIFPICSPKLVTGPRPLRSPADLKHHTLIDAIEFPSIEDGFAVWRGWLKAAHLSHVKAKKESFVSPRWLMLKAVEQGLGVGLARTLTVVDALAQNKLVCPFGPAMRISNNFQLLCLKSAARNPEIVIFRDWIVAEAAKSMKGIRLPGVK